MKRILLFLNPKASQSSNGTESAESILRSLGFQVERGLAQNPEDYSKLVIGRKKDIDLVVLGGGDGTVCCAAQVLMETKIPLGIIPLGTANNVARSLNIPINLEEACKIIAEGHLEEMDLAKVNDQLFVSVVGMGFSTQVHKEVPANQKKRWGSLSYAWQALKIFLRPSKKYFRAYVRVDNHVQKVKALQITVCNGRFYGAHVNIHPKATLTDAMLDLSIIEFENFLIGIIKVLLNIFPLPHSKGLKLQRGKKIEIDCDPPMPLDVEGAPSSIQTPAILEVLPGALKVFVPKSANVISG